jgi:sec-independent protein translocase protein TatB
MFDIGWQELLVLAVLAIIVIGPKDLPRAIKTVTYWIRKARSMARDLQDGLDEVVREAELDDIKREAEKAITGAGLDDKTLAKELEMDDFQDEWRDTFDDFKSATDPDKDERLRDPVDEEVINDIAGLDDDPALAETAPEKAPDTDKTSGAKG